MKNQNKTPKSLIFVFLICACAAIFLNCEGNKDINLPPCVNHVLKKDDIVTEITTKVSGKIVKTYPCTDRILVAIKLNKTGGKYIQSGVVNNLTMSLDDIGYR